MVEKMRLDAVKADYELKLADAFKKGDMHLFESLVNELVKRRDCKHEKFSSIENQYLKDRAKLMLSGRRDDTKLKKYDEAIYVFARNLRNRMLLSHVFADSIIEFCHKGNEEDFLTLVDYLEFIGADISSDVKEVKLVAGEGLVVQKQSLIIYAIEHKASEIFFMNFLNWGGNIGEDITSLMKYASVMNYRDLFIKLAERQDDLETMVAFINGCRKVADKEWFLSAIDAERARRVEIAALMASVAVEDDLSSGELCASSASISDTEAAEGGARVSHPHVDYVKRTAFFGDERVRSNSI